jgi:hypothetical protein
MGNAREKVDQRGAFGEKGKMHLWKLPLALSFILITAAQSPAKDFGDFSIDIPEGWTQKDEAPTIKSWLNPERDQMVIVMTSPTERHDEKSAQDFLAGMKDSLRQGGAVLKEGEGKLIGNVKFQGFKADLPGKENLDAFIGAGSGKLFSIQLLGNPEAPEMKKILESFVLKSEP